MFDRRMMLSFLDGLITESERKQMKKVEQLRAKGTEAGEAAAKSIETRRGERLERVRQARKSGERVPSEEGREERTERARQRASPTARREATLEDRRKKLKWVLSQLGKLGKEPMTLAHLNKLKVNANELEGEIKNLRKRIATKGNQPPRSVRRESRTEDNN
jgi:hypothetical protein